MNKIGFFAPPAPSKPRELTEGEKPYILTRLEYLAIALNSVLGTSPTSGGIAGHFGAIPPENKMIIACTYLSGAALERIENLISRMENFLTDYLTSYGWEEWVNIEVIKTEV